MRSGLAELEKWIANAGEEVLKLYVLMLHKNKCYVFQD